MGRQSKKQKQPPNQSSRRSNTTPLLSTSVEQETTSNDALVPGKEELPVVHPASLPKFGARIFKPNKRFWESNGAELAATPLLLNPEQHLSETACRGEYTRKVKCYGNDLGAKTWFEKLPSNVKTKILNAGFGHFIKSLHKGYRVRLVLNSLAERWSDTTHTIILSDFEMTITPKDFSAITGLKCGGVPLPLDVNFHIRNNGEDVKELLGLLPPDWEEGKISFTWIQDHYLNNWVCKNEKDEDVLVRAFLLYLFGTSLFADTSGKTAPLCFLPALADVKCIHIYDWGGAALATLYRYMDSVSRGKHLGMAGFWRAWEVWAFEYNLFPKPTLSSDKENIFPRFAKYANESLLGKREHRNDGAFFRKCLNVIRESEVNWQPWGDPNSWPEYIKGSLYVNRRRILLGSVAGFAWYLGERVSRQSCDTDRSSICKAPPHNVLTDKFTEKELQEFYRGWEAEIFLLPTPTPIELVTGRLQLGPFPLDAFALREANSQHKSKTFANGHNKTTNSVPLFTLSTLATHENSAVATGSTPSAGLGTTAPDVVNGSNITVELPLPSALLTIPTCDGVRLIEIPMVKEAECYPIPKHVKSVSANTVNALYSLFGGLKDRFLEFAMEQKAVTASLRNHIVQLEGQVTLANGDTEREDGDGKGAEEEVDDDDASGEELFDNGREHDVGGEMGSERGFGPRPSVQEEEVQRSLTT